MGKPSDPSAWDETAGTVKGGNRMGSRSQLRKTHGLPKGNMAMNRDGKTSSSRIRLLLAQQEAGGRTGGSREDVRDARLTWQGKGGRRERRPVGGGHGVTFFLALSYFQRSYFSKFPRRIPYQFPASSWDLKPAGNKAPSHDLSSSELNVDTESWSSRGRGLRGAWTCGPTWP